MNLPHKFGIVQTYGCLVACMFLCIYNAMYVVSSEGLVKFDIHCWHTL